MSSCSARVYSSVRVSLERLRSLCIFIALYMVKPIEASATRIYMIWTAMTAATFILPVFFGCSVPTSMPSDASVLTADPVPAAPSSSCSRKSNPVRIVCCVNVFSGNTGTFMAGIAAARSIDAIMNALQIAKLTFFASSQRYATRKSPLQTITSIMYLIADIGEWIYMSICFRSISSLFRLSLPVKSTSVLRRSSPSG